MNPSLRLAGPLLIGAGILTCLQLITHSALETDLALVGVGVLLSVLLARSWDSWCVASVAFGSVLHVVLSPTSPALGGAVFFASVFLPRALGGRSLLHGGGVMTLALLGGGFAVALARLYPETAGIHFWAANLMGAVAIGSALLPAVDEDVTRRLRRVAHRSKGPIRRSLLRAIVLRRRHAFVVESFSKRAQKRIARAWDELLFVARRQAEETAPRHSGYATRIDAYVVALQSATRAAQASARVATAIDDDVLLELWSEQAHLQADTEAWRDVQQLGSPAIDR